MKNANFTKFNAKTIFGNLAIVTGLMIGPSFVQAQDDRDYAFVVIETTVTKKGVETSDKNPEERRFYISNIVEIPLTDKSAYRNANKSADAYFIKSVVKPMEAKGVMHQYYDENVVVNANKSYVSETRALADENYKETLDGLKEQNANVFSFTWIYGKEPSGLETAKPTLVTHNPQQPLYGVSEIKTPVPPKRKN